MAIIKTIQAGNPILRAIAEVVDDISSPQTQQIITDLVDTMRAEELIGIAAPQIGESVRIFVTEIRKTEFRKDGVDQLRVFINPAIISMSEETTEEYEGCGSVASANFFAPVERSKEVTIEAFNENGEKFTHIAEGLLGRVIQHEIDHLNGILFADKITDMKKIMSREEYLKIRDK